MENRQTGNRELVEPWHIRLLGGLSASQGACSITRFRTQKTGALLAYLALYNGRAHSRDALLTILWPDSELEAARNSLGVALHSLRRQLEPPASAGSPPIGSVLVADRCTVQLRPGAFTTDVAIFEAARLAADRALDDSEAAVHLLEAQTAYTGEFLPGHFDDWVLAERERLADAHNQVLRRLAALSIAESGSAAVSPAPARTTSRPLAEEHTGSSLPLQFTRFFGRRTDIDTICSLFQRDGERLVSLIGMGGIGKTRLAIEAGTRLRTQFNLICFVSLADVAESGRLVDTVREALRLPRHSQADPFEQVTEHLRSCSSCLLVLDNLEHLLGHGSLDPAGAAAAVRMLLRRAPSLSLLVTSRQALNIAAEKTLAVPPLPIPEDVYALPESLLAYDCVRLFVDRAQAHRVDFQVTPRNAEAVARLCVYLDGYPLALELAAAWTKLFTPSQILDRLRDGFSMLESRHHRVIPRHRSLQAVAEWSYALLSEEERRLFRQIAIFRGGGNVPAIMALSCEDGQQIDSGRRLESLARLRDVSLLVTEETSLGQGEEMRFRLPEPLREFALAQWGEEERDALERRHSDYFLRFSEEADRNARGADQSLWFDRLERDQENCRAVIARHLEDEIGLRMAIALTTFWKMRGYLREGAEWFARVLSPAYSAGSSELRARAWNSAGRLAYERTDFAAARTFYGESLRLYQEMGNTLGEANILHNLANIAYREGDWDTAWELYEQDRALHQVAGDEWGVASALGSLGNVADARGDYPTARLLQEECLALARKVGDIRMAAYTLHNLGNLALREKDPDRARRLYEESIPLTRSLGDRRGVAAQLNSRGLLAAHEGDFATAYACFTEALPVLQEVDDRLSLVISIEGMAWYALTGNRWERTCHLLTAAEAARAALNTPRFPDEQDRCNSLMDRARSLSQSIAAFETACTVGKTLSLDSAIMCALAEPGPSEQPV